jgi:nucleotide-binding universal stress UspA family protein
MDFLFLVSNRPVIESIVGFTCHVAELTNSSITVLCPVNSPEEIEKAQVQLEKVKTAVPGVQVHIKVEQGDPASVMLEETKAKQYDMMVLGLRRRRRIVPSAYRFLSQKMVKLAPMPVLLVRQVNVKLERILICTGGIDISMPVVESSAKLAGKAGVKATLLHVVSSVPKMYTGMGEMEETLEELLATDTPLAQHLKASAKILADHGIDSQIEIRQGAVAEEILKEAESGDYDLIAIGDPGSYAIPRLLMGDVTQQIINRSKSAVLVVKQGTHL